ncbi:MAG: dihydroxyacetone kinase subunit DhaL, partial [Fusobacteriaceae bacterium]
MDILKLIVEIEKVIEKNEGHLSELDRAIGDSDHGTNLVRGFKKVKEEIPNLTGLNNAEMFNKIAMLLISNIGGASGALYGTGIMRMGSTMKNKEVLNMEDLILALDALVEGIKMRGKSTKGEKTMLDAIIPAVETLKENK